MAHPIQHPVFRPRLGALVACSLATATPALGAQAATDTVRLTLDGARALAYRANPDLLAVRREVAVARGDQRQASLLLPSNPEIEFLSEGRSGNGPEAVLTQQVEVFGQQLARRSAGRAGVTRASAGAANAARLVLGNADRQFYRLVAANRRASLAGNVLALNQRLADVVSRQLAAGEVSRLEYNLTIVELGRSRARALGVERERAEVAAEFARFLALPQGTPLVLLADSLDLAPGEPLIFDTDSLTALAIARRPDLTEREASVRQARASASVASREGLPSVSLRLLSERNSSGSGQAIRPGIGLTIPVFNRNRGTVQALRAVEARAELERSALEARIRADVARVARAYTSAATELRVLETAVLPAARENGRLLETAYREGKVGLPELLLIRNQVIDAELDYWTVWLAARQSRADLAETTGTNLPANALGALP